jgi:hypothetical protein
LGHKYFEFKKDFGDPILNLVKENEIKIKGKLVKILTFLTIFSVKIILQSYDLIISGSE